MNATVNAFPPLHALNSSRGWFVALIVLLHAGFFWALTNGVSIHIIDTGDGGVIKWTPTDPPKPPPPRIIDVNPTLDRIVVPPIETPVLPPEGPTNAPLNITKEVPPTPPVQVVEGPGSGPLIIEPALDARYPFTEPEYPVSEIRQGHEGTVLLALQILPNGRVGAVRIEQSSGFLKLDDAAAKEARKWRMKPGTSDGAAMAMWKKVPIKFQLKN
jgi:periplasmic protein TonB